jgi:hypothetical protein
LGCDAVDLGVFCPQQFTDVGSKFGCSLLVCNGGACNLLDVFANLVTYVSYGICTLIACFAGCSTAVICLGFEVLDKGFKVSLCFVVVVLDEDGLVFPHHHFSFIKIV